MKLLQAVIVDIFVIVVFDLFAHHIGVCDLVGDFGKLKKVGNEEGIDLMSLLVADDAYIFSLHNHLLIEKLDEIIEIAIEETIHMRDGEGGLGGVFHRDTHLFESRP